MRKKWPAAGEILRFLAVLQGENAKKRIQNNVTINQQILEKNSELGRIEPY